MQLDIAFFKKMIECGADKESISKASSAIADAALYLGMSEK